MKYLKTMLVSILLLIGVLIGSSVSRIPVALATCGTDAWCINNPLNVANVHNTLWDVDAIASNNVWAVGWALTNTVETALAERYNGTSWSISSLSVPNSYSSSLYSVAATSGTDVWAVGDYTTVSGGADQTLIMRWNGFAWNKVTSPNAPNSGDNVLNAVAVVSSTDAWAVGYYIDSSTSKKRTLIVHWNGSQWATVSSPNASSYDNNLQGLTVVNSTNVWASGLYNDIIGPYTLIMRWDGSTWNTVSSANPGTVDALYKIAAITSNDIWSVGGYVPSGTRYLSLTEHWDGSTWSYVSSPNTITGTNSLRGLAPVQSNAVWATGYGGTGTLIEYWNGTQWSIVSSQNQVSGSGNLLYGVSVTPGGSLIAGYTAWTVGYYVDTTTQLKQTLALVYDHPATARRP